MALLGLMPVMHGQQSISTTTLFIINNRTCDITVNWEVSNCIGCPNPATCKYCNSLATGLPGRPYIVIPASSTYTVDIAAQSIGPWAEDCSFYVVTGLYDVFVGLIEIDYQGFGTYGGVSCGCATGTNSCFSSTQTAGGNNAPNTCSGAFTTWSMSWVNNTSGIVVTIN
jgi:hypothetical protein